MEVLALKEELISFKGIKEGIYIFIKKKEILKNIKEELQEKLVEYEDFYNGASILGIKSEDLNQEEIEELLHMIENKFDLYIDEKGLPSHLGEEDLNFEIKEGMTRFYNNTIRSGQVIEYNGNIVIIGDVNPGALVKATGNIVILGGKLRGE